MNKNFKQDYAWQTPYSSKVYEDTVKDILEFSTKRLNIRAEDLTVLDIGAGGGWYSLVLARYVKEVIGVEPTREGYQKALDAKKIKKIKNATFHCNFIEEFQTKKKFDLAIALTVVEHMPQAEKSFDQVYKLLKKGGLVYVTAPNKLWPIESHHFLPFLSWLPLHLANLYVRLFSKEGDSFEDCSYSRTYFGMKRLFRKWKTEFILPSPEASYLGLGSGGKFYNLIKNLGIGLIKRFPIFWTFSKGFILIIQKN